MKVLVSTSKYQGRYPDDFHWTQDGELVYVGFVTCSTAEAAARCGCDRSFAGFDSMKATSTAIVEDRPLTLRAYTALVREAMTRAGWTFAKAARLARELRDVAATFDAGDVVERKDDTVRVRA